MGNKYGDQQQQWAASRGWIVDAATRRRPRIHSADAHSRYARTAAATTTPRCGSLRVRLAERNITSDPPSESELAAIRSDVSAALDIATATVDLSHATEVIGVAGTVTTITAHALGLTSYDPVAISGSRLPLVDVLRSCEALTLMPRAEREALPYMHPGRVDVIASGAIIWATVLRRVADAAAAAGHPLEWVTTSEHDILDGVALSLGNSADGSPVSPV